MDIIKNLQSKPEKQKKIIMVYSLIIIMSLVVFVWFLQMKGYGFSEVSGTELKPLSDLKNEVVEVYNNSAEDIKEIKEQMSDNI